MQSRALGEGGLEVRPLANWSPTPGPPTGTAAFQSSESVRPFDEWLSGSEIFSREKKKATQCTVQEVNAISLWPNQCFLGCHVEKAPNQKSP